MYCIRWGFRSPIGRDNFETEKGRPIVKYRALCGELCKKRLNRSRCCLGCGLRWAQGIVLDGSPEVLRDVAMATNFGMQFAITGCMAFDGL